MQDFKILCEKSMILKLNHNYLLHYPFTKVLEENFKEQSKIH